MGNSREEVRDRILADVSSSYDKTEGTIPWDIAAAVGIEVEAQYASATAEEDRFFILTADRTGLVKRGAELGKTITPATKAKSEQTVFDMAPGTIMLAGSRVSNETQSYQTLEEVTAPNTDVNGTAAESSDEITVAGNILYIGSVIQFTTAVAGLSTGVDYYIVDVDGDIIQVSLTEGGSPENITADGAVIFDIILAKIMIEVECEAVGDAGNCAIGAIDSFPTTIAGVTAVTNLDAANDGFDEEDLEDFRLRVLAAAGRTGNSGNIDDYYNWAKEVSGVGDLRVFPTTDETGSTVNGHVLLRVVDADNLPASGELCTAIELYINGLSESDIDRKAPVGATVHAVAATAVTVDVFIGGIDIGTYDWATRVKPAIDAALTAYFASIGFYMNADGEIDSREINYPVIISTILALDEVLGFDSLTINGVAHSISLTTSEVPVLGAVTKT
jgi:uncharacterized phage protein gp47/JayE